MWSSMEVVFASLGGAGAAIAIAAYLGRNLISNLLQIEVANFDMVVYEKKWPASPNLALDRAATHK